MNRFVLCGLVVALLALAAGAGTAAPVPKEGAPGDSAPDLKTFFTAVGKVVKDERWPPEEDEKKLRDTVRTVFDRALQAADQKGRKLPVEFNLLTRLDVVGEFKADTVEGEFVIADAVRVTTAKNSVILASGAVHITGAANCVIVGRNVKSTSTNNCVVIAGGYIRLFSDRRGDGERSVLIAGQWIRATSLEGTICHVLRPGGRQPPDEVKFAGNRPQPAIQTGSADEAIFLNAWDAVSAFDPKKHPYLPQKNPIANYNP